jgi:hypothetical protein
MIELPIHRLRGAQRDNQETVWSVCRHCHDDIPASTPNMAYCDEDCKKASMAEEMGLPRQ